jgi:peptide/nickel transport system permease protein
MGGSAGSLALLTFIGLAALVGPSLSPYAYDEVRLEAIRKPPSAGHWLGTDELGRDVATRLMVGARISLGIGIAGAFAATFLGATIGGLAGYYGGVIDAIAMRMVDGLLSIPLLPILIVISAFARPSVPVLGLLVAAFAWMETARLARGSFVSLKEREFAAAARALGASDLRIMWRHLLPNAVAPLAVASMLLVGRVMVLESVLSFLGLGVQPPVPSWGSMLYGAQTTLGTEPWLAAFPGLMIFVVVLAVNLLGEALKVPAGTAGVARGSRGSAVCWGGGSKEAR